MADMFQQKRQVKDLRLDQKLDYDLYQREVIMMKHEQAPG